MSELFIICFTPTVNNTKHYILIRHKVLDSVQTSQLTVFLQEKIFSNDYIEVIYQVKICFTLKFNYTRQHILSDRQRIKILTTSWAPQISTTLQKNLLANHFLPNILHCLYPQTPFLPIS